MHLATLVHSIRWSRLCMRSQVEQGLGLGSNHPFFNRHRLAWTRFQPLEAVSQESRKAPMVLVLHGGYGGCVGDALPYDLFTLGGPYSVGLPPGAMFLPQRADIGRPLTFFCQSCQ